MNAASICLFGFDGYAVPDWIRNLIQQQDLAGVILFKRNIESKAQLKELNRELQSLKKGLPLIISVDHEGGRVFRLPEPFTKIPTAREIANPSLLLPLNSRGGGEGLDPYQVGQLMGRELREVGFNLNYAPVLDVDSHASNPIIGDRAFSSDPKIVAQCALEMIRGLESEKVLHCGKHFPGHGDTSKDSHLELPQVDQPLSVLEERELYPFRKTIEKGIEMIMTAHVLYPSLDAEWPATLSKKIITDLLRKKMGYEGVVISDDFNMKAIADGWGIPQASTRFLEAGGDVVLVCRYEEVCLEVIEEVEKWLRVSPENQDRGRQAQARIEKLQQKISKFSQPFSS